MIPRPLVLVEPNAHRGGGHHQRTLLALARAHGSALVIAPHGIGERDRVELELAGAQVLTWDHQTFAGLRLAARAVRALEAVALRLLSGRRWPVRVRRWPHQVSLLARCLTEAGAVRAGHLHRPGAAVVVLSASEALHGVAARLGGPHTRFVHEVVTTEDLPLRLLGRTAGRTDRVRVLAPTAAVGAELRSRFPGLPLRVRPFAVADPGDRLTADERTTARSGFDLAPGSTVACLVGGWWPYKDLLTLDAALAQLTTPLDLLVIGHPVDHGVLERWRGSPRLRMLVVAGPATEEQVRAVYAASDVAVVLRRPGVGKESGLINDVARLGVPLMVTDHDPDLNGRLAGFPWVRTVPAADPAALAGALAQLSRHRLPLPGAEAPALLGLPTSRDQVRYLTTLDNPASEDPCQTCPR